MSSTSILKKSCAPAASFFAGLVLLLPFCSPAFGQNSGVSPKAPAVLSVQVDKSLHGVSPMLYGMMTEEINYSYDGGLYAELVRNRALRDRNWNQQDWLIVQNASAGAKFEKDKATGPSEALNDSIKLTVTAASPAEPAGLRNQGLLGAIRCGQMWRTNFPIYAKADSARSFGPFHVDLVNNKTGKSVGSTAKCSLDWERVEAVYDYFPAHTERDSPHL